MGLGNAESRSQATARQHANRPETMSYNAFYEALGELREVFHRIGRFDDANAKLDELCKLLVLKVLDSRHPADGGVSRLDPQYLSRVASTNHGSPRHLAQALHDVFSDIADHFPEEMQALGPQRGLNIAVDDDEFAAALLPLLNSLPHEPTLNGERWCFDGLNEAFGHFIQDSFRNRKEDAQYMTPPEVVSAAVDIAFHDMVREVLDGDASGRVLVADPTCGVGSFLAAAHHQASHIDTPSGTLADRLALFGQDKVERMVRLSAVNLKVFARARATVTLGNSITPSESLDDIAGMVDLIVTNPPFGATFKTADVVRAETRHQFPVLSSLIDTEGLPNTLDSEYLLLDRELALLKPGGRLLMVVPDHVVSGSGFSERFRFAVLQHAELVAVLDLPAETFAQAGTRTKTSVVYLRRPAAAREGRSRHVVMATAEDLGFRVVSRAGATRKNIVGHNDLEAIARIYKEHNIARHRKPIVCLSSSPSMAAVKPSHLLNNRWTAGFYRVERLKSLESLESVAANGMSVEVLPNIVQIDPDASEKVYADENNRCISVLHVREDGCIDLQSAESYSPSTACVRCRPGDVLLSKINPRIMRICVVPDVGWQVACSSEFAVLRCPPDGSIDPWALAIILRSRLVQGQITSLTSGTSSSHNRIKTRDLAAILLPVPTAGTKAHEQLASIATQYKKALERYYSAVSDIASCYAKAEVMTGSDESKK